jgi:serine/threonine protein kinase
MAEPNVTLGPDADLDHEFDHIVCEVSANLEAGRPVDLDALAEAHPQHIERLSRLLPTLQAMADLGHSVMAGPGTRQSQTGPALTTGVLGDFRILREIGRGGMGVVYEAEQVSLGRRVALKVLPFAAVLDPRQLQRFKNEAQAAAALEHPNIVHVHAVGCERGVHYYAMQFIEGRTLAQVIEELRHSSPLPLAGEGPGVRALISGSPTSGWR